MARPGNRSRLRDSTRGLAAPITRARELPRQRHGRPFAGAAVQISRGLTPDPLESKRRAGDRWRESRRDIIYEFLKKLHGRENSQ